MEMKTNDSIILQFMYFIFIQKRKMICFSDKKKLYLISVAVANC